VHLEFIEKEHVLPRFWCGVDVVTLSFIAKVDALQRTNIQNN
jgi:hypothetical protein